ncbi:cation:proton antiporter, partial [bacterium]|nr:cation:proton antiporter [candidate division CSSED10-310 bacterium]
MRLALLAMLVLLMIGIQHFQPVTPDNVTARVSLTFGFLLLNGLVFGQLSEKYGLPRITGYLIAGIFCGPYVIGIIQADVVRELQFFDNLALALIAFTAGGELHVNMIKRRAGSIGVIAVFQTVLVFTLVTAALFALRSVVPFMRPLSTGAAFGISCLLGIIATATSPSTTVAVIVETKAKGHMTDIVLGITVLKDIIVIISMAVVLTLVTPFIEAGASGLHITDVLVELVLSLAAGAVCGILMVLYLKFIDRELVIFVLGAAFAIIMLSDAFHLHALLVAMTAGLIVTNTSNHGRVFLEKLERASMPVFLVFFSIAGAALDLESFRRLWLPALLFVILRAGATFLGTSVGATIIREAPPIRRLAWMGFLG